MMITAAAMLPAMAHAASEPATLAPGTVVVERETADDRAAAADEAFVDAVGHALLRSNFVTLSGDHSRYVAVIRVARETRGVVTTDAPEDRAEIGVGSWGPQMRVTLPSSKTQLRDLVVTTLTVRLMVRSSGATVWSGSALTAHPGGTVENAPAVIAAKLAGAVLASYPVRTGTIISVP